jgi:5'-3' exonuclease
MGIKYFFSWFKKTFSNHIRTIQSHECLNIAIDTFLVDLNGIFHFCAQQAFQYGSFKPKSKDAKPYYSPKNYCFELVGEYINQLVCFIRPKKSVILCVDGVAPVSKQFQQRQRRYKSSLENELNVEINPFAFDSNCITPGTQFMDELSDYLEEFIRDKMKRKEWRNIKVVFSNEKLPGEGEHKLVAYVREFGDKNDHYMIHGMDADLIMLALASQRENFHILRENPYRQRQEFFYLDMKSIRNSLVHSLLHEPSMTPDQFFINDFIVMLFMSGNDFLPHLPTIDILEGSIEMFFDAYRTVVQMYGNIVTQYHTINTEPLVVLIETLASYQHSVLEERRKRIKDSLLEKHTTLVQSDPETYKLNWEAYRTEYYAKKMDCHSEKDIERACHQYFDGMQWVLTYYLDGVSSWDWYYPYSYAPFCSDLVIYGKTYVSRTIVSDEKPYDPFFQLVCVLPPKSVSLLPEKLQDIMISKTTSMFYPKEFKVDMDGKRNEWEGVVLLPPLNLALLKKEYKKLYELLDPKEKQRNKVGKTIVYTPYKTSFI